MQKEKVVERKRRESNGRPRRWGRWGEAKIEGGSGEAIDVVEVRDVMVGGWVQ